MIHIKLGPSRIRRKGLEGVNLKINALNVHVYIKFMSYLGIRGKRADMYLKALRATPHLFRRETS
jgi:hypothetical protein